MQVRFSERARVILLDNLFSRFGLQLVKLLSQLGIGSKDWCSLGHLMHHMDDFAIGVSVLLQQRRNCLATAGRVGALELSFCVFILRINNDEGAVFGRCCRGLHTDQLAE